MKKGQICEGVIERMDFPNKGIMYIDGVPVIVKNALPGQRISCLLAKKRSGHFEGRLLAVLDEGEQAYYDESCQGGGICGGCLYCNRRYEDTLQIKEAQLRKLLDGACLGVSGSENYVFEGVIASPVTRGYRNKMEFSFGDSYKDGPLALGLHKRSSMYDIVNTGDCRLASEEMNRIRTATLTFFAERRVPYYHKVSHTGYLRHLLLRQSARSREILAALVTTSQTDELKQPEAELLAEYRDMLCSLLPETAARITGIVHIVNNQVADAVIADELHVLYGRAYINEELLGLQFKITPFSFFQTNSLGAEVLYEKVRSYINEEEPAVERNAAAYGRRHGLVFDLYSGTGTIAQIIAPAANQVIGVEIVEEAVEAARENAARNGLTERCAFIAGDVLKVLDTIAERPDTIILDPPRDGVHPRALPKILSYGVERIVYISCKATSLVRDLETIHAYGYRVVRACGVDMFPWTGGIETVCLLSKLHADQHIGVELETDGLDLKAAES